MNLIKYFQACEISFRADVIRLFSSEKMHLGKVSKRARLFSSKCCIYFVVFEKKIRKRESVYDCLQGLNWGGGSPGSQFRHLLFEIHYISQLRSGTFLHGSATLHSLYLDIYS